MKILELEIKNVRGIKSLTLNPSGKTCVVWGPNGTGKSGVIDSVDFLLTGGVTRLIGEGTKDLSLKTHGPHIDTKVEDAFVRARVQIEGIEQPVELLREMAHPTTLQINGCDEEIIKPITSIAERGQHVLTRREILQYVTAAPGTRATQIQTLLNISEVEKIRKNFVKIFGNAKNTVKENERAFDHAKAGLLSNTQDSTYNVESILRFINKQRAILNGSPIDDLISSGLKNNITPPKFITESNKNISLIDLSLEKLKSIQSKSEELEAINDKLLETLTQLVGNISHLSSFKRKELIELGVKMLTGENDSKDCPLCDTEWEEDSLLQYLNQKLVSTERVASYYSIIQGNSKELIQSATIVSSHIDNILNTIALVEGLNSAHLILSNWKKHLGFLVAALESPVDRYLTFDTQGKKIGTLLAPNDLLETLSYAESVLKVKFPKSSPEQNAWDTLTKLEENLKGIEIAELEYNKSKLFEKRSRLLLYEFERCRDKILNELYENIQKRFVELYVELHGEDEQGFSAKLEPKGAALNFEVDFYGRGTHPPHALHSEGHQDSMGLCLFLALAEYLAEGIIDVILLDDVVMSVDADHRRSLCKLLLSAFPNKQFIITTHDKTWANQLKTEGIVNSATLVEFYKWDIETGPHVNLENDIWVEVKNALDSNNISEAAAKLRRGSESFFESICDRFEAPVTYRQNRRWELGHFMPAAFGQYRKYLKQAKSAAESWGDATTTQTFVELDSITSQIYQRTKAEEWGVNSSVHYNEWANLTKNDFQPIAESFEDLFNIFLCKNCGGAIRLVKSGMDEEAIKCNCGNMNWNLTKKKRSPS